MYNFIKDTLRGSTVCWTVEQTHPLKAQATIEQTCPGAANLGHPTFGVQAVCVLKHF